MLGNVLQHLLLYETFKALSDSGVNHVNARELHAQIILNVPLWFYTFHLLLLRLLRQSDKRKFILARPAKVTKTLLK